MARDPDRPRFLPIMGVCKAGRAARPLAGDEEEEEGAITITHVKQSHGSVPEHGRLWGAISSL